MKDEDKKLSEKEFHEKYRDIGLAPYRRVRLEKQRKQREAEEKEQQKEIEESVAENEKLKTELLTNINTFLLDVAISEKWWSRLRKAVESMVINPDTETIILLLTRDEENEDVWIVEAIVSPIKGKGKKYIEVDFGNDKPKKD